MPLMKRKSEKAFKHNIEAEMEAGKPQKQALAIAYSVKRRAKKASGGTVESGSPDMNMAKGGEISASDEKRPMPDNEYNDKIMASHNKAKKALVDSDWTGRPTERQAQMNNGRKVMPIKRPKMVPSDSFSTKIYDQEGNLQDSADPGPYSEQPKEMYDEEGADRQGPDTPSLHMKKMAKGGKINDVVPMGESEEDHEEHPEGLEEDNDQLRPAKDEYMSGHEEMLAEGGQIDDSLDHEEEEEHHNSIAAAIMARKARKAGHEAAMSDSDIDEMMHLYEGGDIMEKASRIKSHDSIYSDDSDQADLSRNHDEDANEEDQLSFNALRKENYNDSNLDAVNHMDSGEHGDDLDSNRHDMISAIRAKMKRKHSK